MADSSHREIASKPLINYSRFACFYDWTLFPLEVLALHRWRRHLWSRMGIGRVLEVGVETGNNFPYYEQGNEVVAVDLSLAMLSRAGIKAGKMGTEVSLARMDVEHLAFAAQSFDTVAASLVFCSVTDPLRGLRGTRRVLKPKGKAFFLEHVRSPGFLGRIMDLFNPLTLRLGENINRRTLDQIRKVGLKILGVERHFLDVVILVEAIEGRDKT